MCQLTLQILVATTSLHADLIALCSYTMSRLPVEHLVVGVDLGSLTCATFSAGVT